MERPGVTLAARHRRRLREVWRSAGWPCRDTVEIELLAAGLLERLLDAAGRETLRVTDAGVQALATTVQRHRAAFDTHEALVARVALEMQRAGRIVWRGLTLRAPLQGGAVGAGADGAQGDQGADGEQGLGGVTGGDGVRGVRTATRWVLAMPDVYSIRLTTVEDYAEPVAHEIKVRRADLLADLRRPDKGAAYRALASQCWYVLTRGIAEPDEVPADYGVMLAGAGTLEVARAAPRRAARVPFAVWMALARSNAEPPVEDDPQPLLGAPP
jgi:hypothetical protein